MRHLQNMALIILATGLMVAYGYVMKSSWPGMVATPTSNL